MYNPVIYRIALFASLNNHMNDFLFAVYNSMLFGHTMSLLPLTLHIEESALVV